MVAFGQFVFVEKVLEKALEIDLKSAGNVSAIKSRLKL